MAKVGHIVCIIALVLLFCGARSYGAQVFTDEEKASTYNPRKVDTAPRKLKQDAPKIPFELKGQEGMIQVGFIIDEEGKTTAIRIVKSTNPVFNDVAIETVKKWKFKPALKDGKKVKVRLVVPLRFK